MIHRFSQYVATYMVSATNHEQLLSHFRYGVECLINECLTDLLLLLIGILTQRIEFFIIWTCSFTLCRLNMGGWHAPTHWLCIMTSCLIGFFCLILAEHFYVIDITFILFINLFCLIYTFCRLPIYSSNHPLPIHRRKKAKYICIVILLLDNIMLFFVFSLHRNLCLSYTLGIWSSIILALIKETTIIINKHKLYY